jgi:hypothetical protein
VATIYGQCSQQFFVHDGHSFFVMNYEPSEKMNFDRNEMSSAERLFHPGFSPESSLM